MNVNPFIFRAYDVRGKVDIDITPEVFEQVGRAYGTLVRRKGGRQLALGMDNRVTSPSLKEILMANIERYCAPGVFDPPTYSQGIKVTGAQTILFLAGQVAYDDKGQPAHRGDFVAQARAVFRAVKAQIEAGGGTMASIVKINTYLTDIRHRADLVPVREEFFGKKGPASTLVAVAALAQPDWLIEVEAIAVV